MMEPQASPINPDQKSRHLVWRFNDISTWKRHLQQAIHFTTTIMADDTRNSAIKEDLSREALTVDPAQKAFSGAQWQDTQAQGYQPPQNANIMPGGTENTAGGQTKEIGLGDAIESIKMEDFTVIHKKPCVRDALMVGIGSGFGVGGVKALVSHRGPSRSREKQGVEEGLLIWFRNSSRLERMQLGRWRMGVWLSRHVPVLPVQTPDGEGWHDTCHGDSQQEGYGEESARGQTREDEGGKEEGQGFRTGCTACGARRGKGGKWRQVMVEALVGYHRQRRHGCRIILCYIVRYLLCIYRPAIFRLVLTTTLHSTIGAEALSWPRKRF